MSVLRPIFCRVGSSLRFGIVHKVLYPRLSPQCCRRGDGTGFDLASLFFESELILRELPLLSVTLPSTTSSVLDRLTVPTFAIL